MDCYAIMASLVNGLIYSEITVSVGCSHRNVATAKRTMTAASITEQRLAALTVPPASRTCPPIIVPQSVLSGIHGSAIRSGC